MSIGKLLVKYLNDHDIALMRRDRRTYVGDEAQVPLGRQDFCFSFCVFVGVYEVVVIYLKT